MERKTIYSMFFFVIIILVLSSCHPRHVSDIRTNMTKEEVISLWGRTDLITHNTVNGKAAEIWEYHFATSNSNCWITFIQDRVTNTQCRPPVPYYYRYAYPYPYGYYYPYYYPYRPY
jgi:hypothetical protein